MATSVIMFLTYSFDYYFEIDPGWPLCDLGPNNEMHSTQRFWWNLVAVWYFLAYQHLVGTCWPLHDFWPSNALQTSQEVLLTKFDSNRACLDKLTSGWPQLTPAWYLTQQCTMFCLGVLMIKFGSHMAFLSNSTLDDLRPLTGSLQKCVLKVAVSSHWDWLGLPCLVQLLTWLQVLDCHNFWNTERW